jgi:NAD(P)-dependent dehydrogenase (short-subunit alcohol dehydrogenase family)
VTEQLRFDGKRVIVTGAGRGFGSHHAKLLASRGARVLVVDNGCNVDGTGSSPEPAEAMAKEINDAGGEAIPVFADVSVEADAARIVKTAVDELGGLDILVNNAGITDPGHFEDLSSEQIRRMTETQYMGTVWVSKHAWGPLTETKGNIVNTASESVLGNVPKCIAYGGAKGGVFSFTRSLAHDGRRLGIRVNAISPRGNTRISSPELLAEFMDMPVETFLNNPFLEAMTPDQPAAAVAFLAHDSCELTGETLVCGGGRVMRIFVSETKGITTDGPVTPEDIVANLDQLMDPTDADLMTIDLPTH